MGRLELVVVLVTAGAASANPAAEKLFEDGRKALAANHLDEACDEFRRSQELEPRVGTLLNLGDCEEKRGKITTAWAAFVEAKTLALGQKDKRAATAEKRAAALVARLPYLTLAVTRVEGLAITRDGVAVPAAEWDHEVPLDPKHYHLEASAPGRIAWTTDIELAEAAHRRIEVPELALAPAPPVDHPPDLAPELAPGLAVDHAADHPVAKPADRPSEPAKPAFAARIAPGAFVGLTSRGDLLYGGRVVLNAAPLGPGWLRAVPLFRRWSGVFPDDAYREFTTTSFGATLEYAMPINPNLFVAGGIGIGIESQDDAYHNQAYFYVPALRITPTAHYDRFEVWVGYELGIGSGPTGMGGAYQSSDRSIELSHRFELGLDFYVW